MASGFYLRKEGPATLGLCCVVTVLGPGCHRSRRGDSLPSPELGGGWEAVQGKASWRRRLALVYNRFQDVRAERDHVLSGVLFCFRLVWVLTLQQHSEARLWGRRETAHRQLFPAWSSGGMEGAGHRVLLAGTRRGTFQVAETQSEARGSPRWPVLAGAAQMA